MKDVPILRVAAIHDLSGFGRASLTVAIPVLATMGIQVCPLPTAVLSSQTGGGMTGFTFLDLTDQMGPMMDHWASLGLKFDAVYSGFLGSPDQSELASRYRIMSIPTLMVFENGQVTGTLLGYRPKADIIKHLGL